MSRNVTAILRDIDTIEKSRHMTSQQKETAIKQLKQELEDATQPQLDLGAPAQGTPKAK